MNIEHKNENIEADDIMWIYRPPTREERIEFLKIHNDIDNIEKILEKYMKVSRKTLKKYGKKFKDIIRNHFGFNNDLRTAWTDMARHRYPYIATGADRGVIYLRLDESPSSPDSAIVKIYSGLGDYFCVDDGRDRILVRDIPSAVEALKFYDKAYERTIRGHGIVFPGFV